MGRRAAKAGLRRRLSCSLINIASVSSHDVGAWGKRNHAQRERGRREKERRKGIKRSGRERGSTGINLHIWAQRIYSQIFSSKPSFIQ